MVNFYELSISERRKKRNSARNCIAVVGPFTRACFYDFFLTAAAPNPAGTCPSNRVSLNEKARNSSSDR